MRFGKRLLVTGGAGFMGSAFIRFGLSQKAWCEKIVNLDLLTYAGDPKKLAPIENDPRYLFVKGDIRDEKLVETLCLQHEIETIVHFAAESHVDRSIASPRDFLDTNVEGTLALLEVVRRLPHLHHHQISTDEVYGSLPEKGFFHEASPYRPNSPYAASKAAADHFVRAYAHTYGISTTLSHATNNYGPFQHSEKFIPRMIASCMEGTPLPVYGQGINVRDWLYVDDHAEAVWMILEKGEPGATYDIGGGCEMRNIDLLHLLIEELAEMKQERAEKYRALITFVEDRPGHDLRYAIDSSKMQKLIGWKPRHRLAEGLKKTLSWCLYDRI